MEAATASRFHCLSWIGGTPLLFLLSLQLSVPRRLGSLTMNRENVNLYRAMRPTRAIQVSSRPPSPYPRANSSIFCVAVPFNKESLRVCGLCVRRVSQHADLGSTWPKTRMSCCSDVCLKDQLHTANISIRSSHKSYYEVSSPIV